MRAPFRVSFRYAGADRLWRDTWRDQEMLPHAVRVQLRDSVTSTVLAFSTATLVHAELPARCAFAKTVVECPGLAGDQSNSGSASGIVPAGGKY